MISDPIAYFITFRTYGTWLHGDERGSTDREHNVYSTPLIKPHAGRQRSAQRRLMHEPVLLPVAARRVVSQTINEVCKHRDWTLHAANVRSNHVHVVVSALSMPEQVMLGFKSWSTRRLRESGFFKPKTRLWSRHGSTKYIWKPAQLEAACLYVMDAQGDDDVPAQSDAIA